MPEMIERMTTVVDKAVRLAQVTNRHRGVANAYCLDGLLVWRTPEDSRAAAVNARLSRIRSYLGCARNSVPNFTSTDDLMRELREGED